MTRAEAISIIEESLPVADEATIIDVPIPDWNVPIRDCGQRQASGAR